MVCERIAKQHYQANDPEMLRLKEVEGEIAALVDEKQPILARCIGAGDYGRGAASEQEWQPPAPADATAHQVRVLLAVQQIGAFGVGEDHLHVGDLLEFREDRS